MSRRRTDEHAGMVRAGESSGSPSALFDDSPASDSDLEGQDGVVISSEVARTQPEERQLTLLQVISQATSNPQVDVAKMSELLALKERIEAREAEMEFNRAMARLAPKLPIIKKRGVIDMGSKGKIQFARYEDLDRAIRPILTEEGFTLSFSSKPISSGVLMVCTLAHVLGHSKDSEMQMPPDPGPGRNGLQAIGSARSYAKRYLACDILNIITEGQDDDGNATSYVTDEQVQQIETMMDACELKAEGRKQFLAFAQADKVEHIQGRDYERCIQALKTKERKIREAVK